MTDINLKTLSPDTSLPKTGFLFGADSQAATDPSVYSTQTVATTLLGSTSLTGGPALTADAPVLNLTQEWSNGAVTFTGVKLNVTNTNSAAASLLMDIQIGGSSKFNIDRNGQPFATNSYQFMGGGGTYAGAFQITFISNGQANFNNEAYITRRGSANLRFGQADAAAPVAQTLSVQSVVTGTPGNVAGQPFTITGSQGVGSGAGGSIIFQVARAGTAGATTQNTLLDVITLSAPSATPLLRWANTNAYMKAADANSFFIGDLNSGASTSNFGLLVRPNSGLTYTVGAALGFAIGANLGSFDVFMARDNADILALKNGTNAQEFRVYETTTGSIYKAILGNRQLIKISGASFDNGAGAQAGTITNSPTAGNPTKWIPIDDNGTTRYIPAW
jgi:hypothetical protein